MAPNKIYINVHPLGVDYSIVPIPDFGGVEYIRKDSLLEWAKERYKAIENDNQLGELFKQGVLYELHRVIDKIESL